MKDDKTDTACQLLGGYCTYKLLNGTVQYCGYCGYCDYQAPKDSRNKLNKADKGGTPSYE